MRHYLKGRWDDGANEIELDEAEQRRYARINAQRRATERAAKSAQTEKALRSMTGG